MAIAYKIYLIQNTPLCNLVVSEMTEVTPKPNEENITNKVWEIASNLSTFSMEKRVSSRKCLGSQFMN